MQTQDETMMTVLLYGFLGKKFGKVHKYAVKTPAEAIRALCMTIKDFKESVIKGGSYKVCVGGKEYRSKEQLNHPMSVEDTLRLIPVVSGSGGANSGWAMIIIGIILVVVTWGVYGWDVIAAGGSMASYGFYAGVALIASGVSTLMMVPPTQQAPGTYDTVEKRASKVFNGSQNTAAQGNPVPICYGKLMVGSQVISAGLSVDQV